jgi:hypothetical protein
LQGFLRSVRVPTSGTLPPWHSVHSARRARAFIGELISALDNGSALALTKECKRRWPFF